jgi:cell division protein FtsW (lipid II flippase)
VRTFCRHFRWSIDFAAKAFLWPHIACLLLACFGVGAAFSLGPNLPVRHHNPLREAISSVTFWLAGISFLTGLMSMACRRGKQESRTFAASTVASFLVLLSSLALTMSL